ncbi:E3 SUMO-protein ligase ZBED1-like [Episyrphus balteatus]|uniref:E3 SUMO-protein ligase ZBED1-like n=1 Tax=Episyrphus balteatus TaxID=286459 RepID=UPI002485EB83|nr:E3 SUMO-protein ligase ZBED1-like [Episyrphus balteatus]
MTSSSSSSAEPPRKKRRRNDESYNAQRQEQISRATAYMISANGLPISFVESIGFKHFMSVVEPNYKVPVASTILSRLQFLYNQVHDKIKNAIGPVSFVALTTDGWSSRAQDSFISVTLHYVNDDWELKNFTLCAEYMEERHTAENLALILEMVIAEWDLQGKVSAVVTDNAANVVASVRYVEEIQSSYCCAAHTLQICIKRSLQSVQAYQIILKKASTLVSHFHHSNLAASELSRKQLQLGLKDLKLIQSCPTRWSSSYFMCERLIANRAAVLAVLADRTVTSSSLALKLEINEREWTLLEELTRILKPFQVATTILCQENVTISILRPIINGLINKHLVITDDDDENTVSFLEMMKTNLRQRFKMGEEIVNEVLTEQISSFLDPRHKNLEAECEIMRDVVRSHVRNLIKDISPNENEQIANEQRSAMDFLLKAKSTNEPLNEFDRYLREPQIDYNVSEPLMWWKNNETKYPSLALLAKKILCIPATSVSSERCFSAAGNVVSSKRASLLPENVSLLTFLMRNQKLLQISDN